MATQQYQEFITERARLLERIRELEAENAELRKRLGEKVATLPLKPTAMRRLSLQEKVELFRSLFNGRTDVFARRWYSKTSGKAGYQPVCQNEWSSFCDKKSYKCADCPNRRFSPLTDKDVYRYLEGKDADGRDVIGLYVLNEDNTCRLLCTDFDDKNCEHGYQNDVLAFVDVCKSWDIPCSIERSRSGNGAHVWIFFESPVLAVKARRLGNAILTEAMNRDGKIDFKSYDRFFPNGKEVVLYTREETDDTLRLKQQGISVIYRDHLSLHAAIIDKALSGMEALIFLVFTLSKTILSDLEMWR